MDTLHDNHPDTQEQTAVLEEPAIGVHIGLLGNYADSDETRLLLTPEACGLITSAGVPVSMESGAGVDISFSDDDYARFGVKIVSREEALRCNVVLSFLPLQAADIRKMTKGAALLCMMGPTIFEVDTIKALIDMQISAGCLDNMLSHHDVPIFADIIDEIDGRSAVMYAEDALSYLGGGKGVLLGGVTGLNPCEVIIIGTGTAAVAAANAAISTGARVVLMDNDISALHQQKAVCHPSVELVAIHPRVLANHVKAADVIITGTTTHPFEFPKSLSSSLKDNVYILDLTETHPSVSVPRTVAMALSNVLVNFVNEMAIKNDFIGMVSTTPGVQCGMVTFEGKLVDKLVGSYTSLPSVDIRVMLSATN